MNNNQYTPHASDCPEASYEGGKCNCDVRLRADYKLYPQEVKAFKSKSGSLYATPIEAVQADYRDKIDEWWLSDERLHSDPNSIQFLYRNMTKIAEILQGFPVKAKP